MITPTANDLYYPSALTWMWNYCTWLGKFTDSRGINYDLGVYTEDDGELWGAIVCGNEPGDYYSGEVSEERVNRKAFHPHDEKYIETYKRAKLNNLL